jgi:hypothetical protein
LNNKNKKTALVAKFKQVGKKIFKLKRCFCDKTWYMEFAPISKDLELRLTIVIMVRHSPKKLKLVTIMLF